MLIIPVIKDGINKALKQFKTKFKKTGILKEIRERKQYIKKSTKRKLAKEKAIFKQKYKEDNDE
jgi:small subunit ribosomal protein S21|tara:strand:+ start:166 stop:357 length:192 start_codon:yes stop_codon:yes gene_type:complete